MVQVISFEDISQLELCQPLFVAELNHLCNFGSGHHEELFCEIISKLDQWFRRCIRPNESVCAILVEAIISNNSVKLF